ncbi:hypothetical protein [Rubritalea sp.]|uniref:hypothetical protein n=1 Tax=Rubritalea sp. TaxID=2109375 RepID=UPI003EFABE90
MQTLSQRYVFFTIAILSSFLLTSVGRIFIERFDLNYESFSQVALPTGILLVVWIYPLKIFNDKGSLIGMHRQALKASMFFLFTFAGMYIDELFALDLPVWFDILIPIGLLLMAILLYKILLCALSNKNKITDNAGSPAISPTQ